MKKPRRSKRLKYKGSNSLEIVNQIKQLALFTLQKGDVDGFNLLKRAEINFKKTCSGNKNLKLSNIAQYFKF